MFGVGGRGFLFHRRRLDLRRRHNFVGGRAIRHLPTSAHRLYVMLYHAIRIVLYCVV